MSVKTQLECLAVLFVWIRRGRGRITKEQLTHQGTNHLPAFQNRRKYIKKKVQTFGENFHSILEKVSNSFIKN